MITLEYNHWLHLYTTVTTEFNRTYVNSDGNRVFALDEDDSTMEAYTEINQDISVKVLIVDNVRYPVYPMPYPQEVLDNIVIVGRKMVKCHHDWEPSPFNNVLWCDKCATVVPSP
jgi:hypothetical protein